MPRKPSAANNRSKAQDVRGEAQDARSARQSARGVAQDARGEDQDATGVEQSATGRRQELQHTSMVSKNEMLLSTAQTLVDAVSGLRDELIRTNSEYESKRRRDRIIIGIMVFIMALGMATTFRQSQVNGEALHLIKSAVNPEGKIYERGQNAQGCAILNIVNDSRSYHGQPLLDPNELGLNCE